MSRRAAAATVAALVAVCLAPRTRAAEVRVAASAACVEASSISEQVDTLLGRPVASIEGVDFEVAIARESVGRWSLNLATIDRERGSRRTRALTAGSCAELADAAAVAITMSIKASAEEGGHGRPAAEPPAAAPATPTIVVAPAAPAPRRASLELSLSGLVDAGAMPRAAFGLGLAGTLDLQALRLVIEGALFPSQDTHLGDGAGAELQLVFVAGLACFTNDVGRLKLLACGGGEAGRLTGAGFGVSNPRSRGALWLAGRAELGASFLLGPRLALVASAGAALPALRPTFELDATTVYRPSALTGRATVGVALAF